MSRILQLVINREKEYENSTIGTAVLYDNSGELFKCKTLELSWENNMKYISRIPADHYKASLHNSPKFGKVIKIKDVGDRTHILIHVGNYPKDTLGCILVGQEAKKDFISNSRKTLNELLGLINENDELYVNVIDSFNKK